MLIRDKVAFVYDVEVFPNYFGVTIKNTESGKHRCLEIYWDGNDMPEIAKIFLNKKIHFVSYNGIHYDRPLISYILLNYKELIKKPTWEINLEIKRMSDLIVNSENSTPWKRYKYANIYDDLDLLAMKWSQKLRVSLKALQVTMEYKNVEEYDGNFDAPLPKEDVEKVRAYEICAYRNIENWVNCWKAKDLFHANQQPSRKYTFWRFTDYLRSLVFLITGSNKKLWKSAQLFVYLNFYY